MIPLVYLADALFWIHNEQGPRRPPLRPRHVELRFGGRPPSPEKPYVPSPATVVMIPSGETCEHCRVSDEQVACAVHRQALRQPVARWWLDPVTGCPTLPAIVVMIPLGIPATRPLPVSAMNRLPAPSTATFGE
jgi:hypothetical protein